MNIRYFMWGGNEFVTLDNGHGFEVTLCDCGASIYEIKLNNRPMNITPAEYSRFKESKAYFGKTVGRINGRIPDAILNFKGEKYPLQANEGKDSLHGGRDSLSFVRFKMNVCEETLTYNVLFTYTSKDGEAGYPGTVNFVVRYLIDKVEPILKISFQALANKETPIALTNHLYFNLGGEENILNHRLYLASHQVAEFKDGNMPTGNYQPIDSLLDFSEPHFISEHVEELAKREPKANGYDHIYLLDKEAVGSQYILENNHYQLSLTTDFPCIVVYSMNYPPDELSLNNGYEAVKYAGITAECAERPLDFKEAYASSRKKYSRYITLEFLEKRKMKGKQKR